jgi:hypothetical protein
MESFDGIRELGPMASRFFVPRSVVERIIREAPLDAQFVDDVNGALRDTVDAL